MRPRHLTPILFSTLCLISLVLPGMFQADTLGRDTIAPKDDPELPPIGFFRGITPISGDGQTFDDAYLNTSKHSQFVPIWGKPTPFWNMSYDLSGWWGDTFVEDLVRGNGMFPVLHINFYGENLSLLVPPSMGEADLNDTDWRGEYKQAALDVLETTGPRYLSIGNEVNRWFEKYGLNRSDNNSFANFVSLYEEIYDELKARSPETNVFCTFSREIVDHNREANLSVLELFDPSKLDILAFTSYPISLPGVHEPQDLPDDYYSRAGDMVPNKPFALIEAGWPSNSTYSSEEHQAGFIRNVTGRLSKGQGLDLHMFGWCWLHDLLGGDTYGLIERGGRRKESYTAWQMNSRPGYNSSAREVRLDEDFGSHDLDLTRIFYDPDPWDVLNFSIHNGTAWTDRHTRLAQYQINGSMLEMTSLDNISGSSMLAVRVTDYAGATTFTQLQVSIDPVNDAPVLIGSTLHRTWEDLVSSIDVSELFIDSDDAIMDLRVEIIESPMLDISVDMPYLSIRTEYEDWNGFTYALLRVSDPAEESVSINLTIEVISVNDPPMITAPDKIVLDEDEAVSYPLLSWGGDRDDEALLSWNVTSADSGKLNVEYNESTLELQPFENWHGTTWIEVNLSDGMDFDRHVVEVEVRPINDPPLLGAVPVLRGREDRPIYLQLEILEAYDPDGDQINWVFLSKSEIISSVSFTSNDTMVVWPVSNAFGEGWVNATLKDRNGGGTIVHFKVTVEPVNDPPVLLTPDDWAIEVMKGSSETLDLSGYAGDVESPISELVLLADSDVIAISDLSVLISIPSETVADEIYVNLWVVDPEGDRSELRKLIIIVREDPNSSKYGIEAWEFSIEKAGGSLLFILEGDPHQIIWVVFSDNTSLEMSESPPGSGHYELLVKDPGWTDGQELIYYFSAERNGPNDTQFSPTGFIYTKGGGSDGDDGIPPLFLLLGILTVLGIMIILFAIFKKRRSSYDDFDYRGLLEE